MRKMNPVERIHPIKCVSVCANCMSDFLWNIDILCCIEQDCSCAYVNVEIGKIIGGCSK